jgi:outer membrane biosynthesis protein TonB
MGLRFKFNSKSKTNGPRIKLVLVNGTDEEVLTEFESPIPAATLLSDLEVRCDETDAGMNLVIDAALAALPVEEKEPPPPPKKRMGRPKGSTNKPKAEKVAEVKEKVAEAKAATPKAKETPVYSEEPKAETKTETKKADEKKQPDERRSAAASAAAKVVEDARAKAKGKSNERETFVDEDGRTIDAATGEVLAELDKALGGKTENAAPAAASADPF